MNILKLLNDQIATSLTGQAAEFLGEPESGVSDAIKSIFPFLFGKIIDLTQEKDGTQKLFDLASSMDTSILNDIGSTFSQGAGNIAKLMNTGSGILNLLLGSKTNEAIESIAKFSGLKSSTSSSLIKIASPFLMSALGRQINDQALDTEGFENMLRSQKNMVSDYLPDQLSGGIKTSFIEKAIDKIEDFAEESQTKLMSAGESIAEKGETIINKVDDTLEQTIIEQNGTVKGLLKWLIPSLVVLALLSFVLNKACAPNDHEGLSNQSGARTTSEGNQNNIQDESTLLTLFNHVDADAKTNLDTLNFKAGTLGEQIMTFINNGADGDQPFTFRSLKFDAGSAKINQTAAAEIDDLASILKAYPSVNIQVNGYTDSSDDALANRQLSKAQANAVKARLIAMDIDPVRITTNGYGDKKPIAENDSDEGRKQNSRIEIKLVR